MTDLEETLLRRVRELERQLSGKDEIIIHLEMKIIATADALAAKESPVSEAEM